MDTQELSLPIQSNLVSFRKYEEERDYFLLKEWWERRGQKAPSRWEVPCFGITALYDGFPIAMGFIRHCEGNYAIFDSLTTDPEASSKDRHLVLEALVPEIIKVAKDKGYKILFGMTIKNDIILRSKKHGFVESEFKLISLRL